jgi:hypothetical protein
MQQEIISDLHILISQLDKLKQEFNISIANGKSFVEVKAVHLQIKELTKLIDERKNAHETDPPFSGILEANASADNITIDTLLPLREYMSLDQLERYGVYLMGQQPDNRFTQEEISELELVKSIRANAEGATK